MKNSEKPVRTVVFMMSATVLSKFLGMLRGVLVAAKYGTGIEANALSEASNITLKCFDMLLSAAILGCFIPIYNSFGDSDRYNGKADTFACIFFNAVLAATGILALLGIILAEPLIAILAPGLDSETKALSVRLLRLLFPMIIFTGAAYTAVGVMQSKGRFLFPALVSSISNGGVIIYLLFIDGVIGEQRIYGLATAYLISWLLQFATLAIPLAAGGFRYKLLLDFKNPALLSTIKMAPSIMVGSWLMPVSFLIGTFFAPFAVSGNVTVFDYANNAYIIIAGTLTYSICNYIFPKLSRISADGGDERFKKTVRVGLLASMLIIIPFTAASFVLRGEGIAVLYMRKAFSPDDARLTAETFKYISLGMPAFGIIEILSRAFYSRKQNNVPMAAALCGIAANILSSYIFIIVLKLGMGSVGLALTVGQYAAGAVLVICAAYSIKGLFTGKFIFNIITAAISGILAFVAMRIIYAVIGNDPYGVTMTGNIAVSAAVFAAGAAVYICCIAISKKSLIGGLS